SDRAPLPALDPPAPERRPGRMGSGALRRRAAGCDPRPAAADASRGRPAALGGHLLRLAHPRGVRRGPPAPGLAAPPRAPIVLRHGLPLLVACAAGRATPADVRRARDVPLRGVRRREPARAHAGAHPTRDLRLLRAGARSLGTVPTDRP